MNRFLAFLIGALLGAFVIFNAFIFTQSFRNELPFYFESDADARIYQQLCLANGYSVTVRYNLEDETIMVTCKEVEKHGTG